MDGPGAEAAQPRLAEYGAAKVYVAVGAEFDDYVVAPKAELLAELVRQKSPSAVLLASTAEGKEIGGRLAVKIGSGILTDVVGLGDDFIAEQLIFGGAINVSARVRTGTPIIAVRPNAISPEPGSGAGHHRAGQRDDQRARPRRPGCSSGSCSSAASGRS